MSLAPVAPILSDKLSLPVLFLNDCIGSDVEEALQNLQDGQIVLLENLRFHKGETENDPTLQKVLPHMLMPLLVMLLGRPIGHMLRPMESQNFYPLKYQGT